MSTFSGFRAIYDTQEILEWDKPNFYSHIFRVFKEWANYGECSGVLFYNNTPIRATGKNKEFIEQYFKKG